MTSGDEPAPLVSVVMLSLNHGRYIRQAIQSVIDQERPFGVELLISDDGSTDDTLSIVAEFAAAHPDLIRIVSPKEHLGLGGNFRHACLQCRGKYIAMLDSDDYWLSRNKLVRQAAALESDPQRTLCFHNAVLWTEWNQTSVMKLAVVVAEFRGGSYFLKRNPITTMTAMFRNIVDRRVLDTLPGLDLQDLPLWVHLADIGSVKCLPDVFGFYRIHRQGTYARSSNLQRLQTRYESLRRVREFVSPETGCAMDREFAGMLLILSLRKLIQNQQIAAARADWREARKSAARGNVGAVAFLSLVTSAIANGLYFGVGKLFVRRSPV
ncbi:MAG: glycosyltransferase [Proteobacteria bacterium]|nr:glycosyltransferase [Pseudomonadota bacterium]